MKVIIDRDGEQETIEQFILIKVNGVPGEFVRSECISNIKSPLYRSQILGDHCRWEGNKELY